MLIGSPFALSIMDTVLVDSQGNPPWMRLVQPSDENAFSRLSSEISAFIQLIQPTAKEEQVRRNIIDRLQIQVRKIWPTATVVPIGSIAQGLYTSSSDLDLFISHSGDLNLLFEHMNDLAAPGTLTIVPGARIPIIKYVDACGSGIQVDVSMNNGSATASTHFVLQTVSQYPILRPLTILLKQWLLQRKMNEVYQGGLSSYALFLLVLTTVRQQFPCPHKEALGRALFQFFHQWATPVHPLGLFIRDPVNPENVIGHQSFSFPEIQLQWEMSFNALNAALTDYDGNRERSLLSSILGLTTR